MFRSVIFLLIFTVAAQAASVKDKTAFIQSAVEKTIETADPTAQVGIEVVSLNGELSYERNSEKRYVPGSSVKLFVAAAALDLLGESYQFETRMMTDGKVKKGELVGNCYLVASGDPSLDVEGLEEIVLAMKANGVDHIKGDLVLDLSVFDDITQGPGWMWDDTDTYGYSPVSGIILEHNCIQFTVKPSSEAGRPCYVDLYPRCGAISIINRSITGKGGSSANVRRLYDGRFEVVGSMEMGDQPKKLMRPVREPHEFTGDIMKVLFKQNQIVFEGEVKVGMCVKHVKEIGTHRSKPLAKILLPVLKDSDNLYADALFKKVGEARYGVPGTWQKGSRSVRDFLEQKVGLDISEMVLVDGCGASRYNLVSPRQMVLFLKWVHEKFLYREALKAALPIAGVDGSLRKRMTAPYMVSKVRAKTGTMTGVSALCGYLNDDAAFAIFVNGYVKKGREIKGKIEDEICHVLLNSGL
ncbi:D-alanyl-D-alanine carboxypeptidase/D-alanyl-D-alanine endopeptidase [Simkania sp.]|uniref:D-alanyl-D-alanine carboxypeptidase/D-alanyl-D-alanine endopeptidase n=1 Tax=Simkania sp. TaxID=34094 RepID=UPI003B51700E